MAEKFLMPKLSPTMEEGQISRWVKSEGDKFDANETLAEVDTDKATMEMTALSGGTLLKILKGDGETAALGETIAIIGNAGEDISALLSEVASNGKSELTASKSATEVTEKEVAKTESPTPETVPAAAIPQSAIRIPQSEGNGRMIVSPIAARMAAENGIDLKSITGSGPNGRIIKRDIEVALSGPRTPAVRTFTPATQVGASAFRDENTSQMRRVIASRLAESIGLRISACWPSLRGPEIDEDRQVYWLA